MICKVELVLFAANIEEELLDDVGPYIMHLFITLAYIGVFDVANEGKHSAGKTWRQVLALIHLVHEPEYLPHFLYPISIVKFDL
jgi:hypothetical protein